MKRGVTVYEIDLRIGKHEIEQGAAQRRQVGPAVLYRGQRLGLGQRRRGNDQGA